MQLPLPRRRRGRHRAERPATGSCHGVWRSPAGLAARMRCDRGRRRRPGAHGHDPSTAPLTSRPGGAGSNCETSTPPPSSTKKEKKHPVHGLLLSPDLPRVSGRRPPPSPPALLLHQFSPHPQPLLTSCSSFSPLDGVLDDFVGDMFGRGVRRPLGERLVVLLGVPGEAAAVATTSRSLEAVVQDAFSSTPSSYVVLSPMDLGARDFSQLGNICTGVSPLICPFH